MSRKEIQREKNEQCAERHALAVDRLRSMVSEETAAEKRRIEAIDQPFERRVFEVLPAGEIPPVFSGYGDLSS